MASLTLWTSSAVTGLPSSLKMSLQSNHSGDLDGRIDSISQLPCHVVLVPVELFGLATYVFMYEMTEEAKINYNGIVTTFDLKNHQVVFFQ